MTQEPGDAGSWRLLRPGGGFGALWSARVISFAGDQLTVIALTLLVHARYGTGPAVAGLLIAAAAPRLLGPIAGAIADRVEQRRLMRSCELAKAVVVAAIALTLPPLPVLLVLVTLVSALATLFMPAGRSAIPVLVAHQDLTPANALLATGTNIGLAIGPAIGGGLVALIGTPATLIVDAGTSLVAVVLLGRLPDLRAADDPTPAGTVAAGGTAPSGLRRDLVDGLRYVAGERTLRAALIGLCLGVAVAAMANVAAVFLIRDTLGAGPTAFGVFASVWGIGMISGSLALARWGRRLDPTRLFAGGWLLTGTGVAVAGAAPGVVVATGAFAVGGVGNGLENVGLDTTLQRIVPRRLLGRAFGTVYTAAFVGEIVAFALAGPLLEVTGPRTVFVVAGLMTVLTGIVLLILLPRLGPPDLDGGDEGVEG